MTFPAIQPSFSSGEIAPSVWGRVDLEQFHAGAATMRNMFVNYRGGAASRAGTAYVSVSKQPGSGLPPRVINFQFNINQGYALEFGNLYMRVVSQGAYVLDNAKVVTGATQAAQAQITTSGVHGYAVGDEIYINDIVGMTELNGQLYLVEAVPTTSTILLTNLFGEPIDSTGFDAYVSGGTVARVFTLATPYLSADLPALKFTQSADAMSIVHQSYAPRDLIRASANSWTLTATTFGVAIGAPAAIVINPTVTTTVGPTEYAYVATAVDRVTGQESLPSARATVTNSVNMSQTAGAMYVRITPVAGASSYNYYRGPVGYGATVPIGGIYGFVGSALGGFFLDGNIIADMTKGPPQYQNPFAPGQILAATITAFGTGYTSAPTVSVVTSTGSGASLQAVMSDPLDTVVRSIYVVRGGQGYVVGDTVSITGGGGAGATASLTIGPATGTYPSVVAYFQQRRVYANTLNNPDTYFMSQIGAYANFSSGFIPIGSDAVIGTPWAQQVNGIQALVPMPGGLVALTGLGAWQINGGGSAAAITPTDQSAQPQAFNGIHATIPPIVVNFDILYVQSKGTIVRDLAYDFLVNIYTGTDVTVLSSHLFEGFQLKEWAWAEEPWKTIWAVRDDGALLSLAYIKEQKVNGWARHDTNGLFKSVCSVTELPINAVYVVVQRYLHGAWYYVIERFDNRLWNSVEDTWAVDCGLSLPQPEPAATLIMDSATGSGGVLATTMTNFGSGYLAAPTVVVNDATGVGAVLTANLTGDQVTSLTIVSSGTGYTSPTLSFISSSGAGAAGYITKGQFATFTADAAVFNGGNVGDVIRAGGGKATILAVNSATEVEVNITEPVVATVPNNPSMLPVPALSGNWSMTTPVTTVSGLDHLEGLAVSVLADGSVVTGKVVENGAITLPEPASSVVVGLGFTAQLQSMYLDVNSSITVQGKRKNVQGLTIRVFKSRGIRKGPGQLDASTMQPIPYNPPWTRMIEVKDRGADVAAGSAIPLFTGDLIETIPGTWSTPGQVSMDQIYPLPFNCLAIIPQFNIGDTSS